MAGLSSVSTTIPPSSACARIPAGWTAASQTRSRRLRPPGRNRHAATNTSTAISVMATVSIRLPNSIQVWNIGSPAECAATRLPRVHCGQSGQPRPDSLCRTAAPVAMIPAVPRMAAGEGFSTAATARRVSAPAPGAVPRWCSVSSAGTDPC